MSAGRKGKGWEDGGVSPANDTSLDAAPGLITPGHADPGLAAPAPGPGTAAVPVPMTSPAFDRWLERQMKMLFAACEEPADEKLIKLIREDFANNPAASDPGKVTK